MLENLGIIPRKLVHEIVVRARNEYSDPDTRFLVTEYSLALQILVRTYGQDLLSVLDKILPRIHAKGLKLVEDSRALQRNGFIKIRHTLTGSGKADYFGRIINFGRCTLDLRNGELSGSVTNFERVKAFCTRAGLKARPFEHTYYEIIIAASMARHQLSVEFLPEGQVQDSCGRSIKTPDLLLSDGDSRLLVECKSNVFQNLDSVSSQDVRTKRAVDLLERACEQISEYGKQKQHDGVVFVQYMQSVHLGTDKEYLRGILKKIIGRHRAIYAAAFTYEQFQTGRVYAGLKAFGSIKDFWYQQLYRRIIGRAVSDELRTAVTFAQSRVLPSLQIELLK